MEHVQVLHSGHEYSVGAGGQVRVRTAKGLRKGGVRKPAGQVGVGAGVDEQVYARFLRRTADDGDAARLFSHVSQRLIAGVLEVDTDRPGRQDTADGFPQLSVVERAPCVCIPGFDVRGNRQRRGGSDAAKGRNGQFARKMVPVRKAEAP
ncbi:hypothetical protein D9M72_551040 [compost metagenome]